MTGAAPPCTRSVADADMTGETPRARCRGGGGSFSLRSHRPAAPPGPLRRLCCLCWGVLLPRRLLRAGCAAAPFPAATCTASCWRWLRRGCSSGRSSRPGLLLSGSPWLCCFFRCHSHGRLALGRWHDRPACRIGGQWSPIGQPSMSANVHVQVSCGRQQHRLRVRSMHTHPSCSCRALAVRSDARTRASLRQPSCRWDSCPGRVAWRGSARAQSR
jgi:hypothetical protein